MRRDKEGLTGYYYYNGKWELFLIVEKKIGKNRLFFSNRL